MLTGRAIYKPKFNHFHLKYFISLFRFSFFVYVIFFIQKFDFKFKKFEDKLVNISGYIVKSETCKKNFYRRKCGELVS